MEITQERILETIISASETDPLFVSFMTIAEQQLEDEQAASMSPDLTSEARAYNCGRASAIYDFINTVKEIRLTHLN